jgi:transposase
MSTRIQHRSSKEPFWRETIRQWRASGLTVREFCARHDLSEPSFYAWKRTLAERDAPAPAFVPVRVVVDEAAAHSSPVESGSGLELVLRSGRRLRIGPDFDGPTLQRLLALLEEGQP